MAQITEEWYLWIPEVCNPICWRVSTECMTQKWSHYYDNSACKLESALKQLSNSDKNPFPLQKGSV